MWWLLRAGGAGEPGEAAEGHGAAGKVHLSRTRQKKWAKIGPLSPVSSCPRISQSGQGATEGGPVGRPLARFWPPFGRARAARRAATCPEGRPGGPAGRPSGRPFFEAGRGSAAAAPPPPPTHVGRGAATRQRQPDTRGGSAAASPPPDTHSALARHSLGTRSAPARHPLGTRSALARHSLSTRSALARHSLGTRSTLAPPGALAAPRCCARTALPVGSATTWEPVRPGSEVILVCGGGVPLRAVVVVPPAHSRQREFVFGRCTGGQGGFPSACVGYGLRGSPPMSGQREIRLIT